MFTILEESFQQLPGGGRFEFENDPDFSKGDVAAIKKTTFGDVTERNAQVKPLGRDVFFAE